MKTVTKHYVQFFYPGLIVAESSTREIDHRNPQCVDVPSGAYAFNFFDRKEGADNGLTLKSEPFNESKTYYPSGKLMTLEDVRRDMPDSKILISNMEINGYTTVVETASGWAQPYDEKTCEII